MIHGVLDMVLSLLPARYRRRWQMNPVAATFRSGVVQGAAGLLAYFWLFFQYLNSFGSFSGSAMAGPGLEGRGLYSTSFGLGVIGWLSFSITPGPLLAMYCMLEGTVRALCAGVTHEPMASLPFWVVGQAHDAADRAQKKKEEAPPAPDVVEMGTPGCGWDFRITCVRKKEGWNSLVQVEYNGEYYGISSSGEEVVDGQARYRYYLKKAGPLEGHRGIVKYDPFEFYKE